MRLLAFILSTLLIAVAVLGWPVNEIPTATDDLDLDMLEKPMHTTALMAGAAWKLTEHARTATRSTTTIPTPSGTPTTSNDAKEMNEL
jgi:hypothetical protein